MTGKPTVAGNWVYSFHDYNFSYETFSDGVPRHDDFGITLDNVMLANATSWKVPLYIGEFTNFTFGSATNQTDATMAETDKFLAWAKTNKVNWTFWAYVNPYLQMTLVDPATNQPYPVIKNHLATGLDTGANQSPTASFTKSCTDLACSFNGSGSADPDGTVASYAWAFGDGSTATGATPSHTYGAAGTYTVTLTVTDNAGATATASQSVTVSAGTATVYAADTFTRTVSSGWGSADTGGGWTTSSPSTCSVGGGVGVMTMAAGTGPSTYLTSVSATATDLQVTASTDKAATGGGTYLYVIGRRVAGQGDYRAKVRLLAGGQVALTLLRVDAAGAETVIKAETVLSGLTSTGGTTLRIRLQVTGTGPTTLRAKVWPTSGTEPASWNQTGVDSTAGLQSAGGVGLKAYLSGSATNAPVVARFDDLGAGPATP